MSSPEFITTALAMLRTLLDVLVPLVGRERLQVELDEAAVRRANLAADAAEAVKFR